MATVEEKGGRVVVTSDTGARRIYTKRAYEHQQKVMAETGAFTKTIQAQDVQLQPQSAPLPSSIATSEQARALGVAEIKAGEPYIQILSKSGKYVNYPESQWTKQMRASFEESGKKTITLGTRLTAEAFRREKVGGLPESVVRQLEQLKQLEKYQDFSRGTIPLPDPQQIIDPRTRGQVTLEKEFQRDFNIPVKPSKIPVSIQKAIKPPVEVSPPSIAPTMSDEQRRKIQEKKLKTKEQVSGWGQVTDITRDVLFDQKSFVYPFRQPLSKELVAILKGQMPKQEQFIGHDITITKNQADIVAMKDRMLELSTAQYTRSTIPMKKTLLAVRLEANNGLGDKFIITSFTQSQMEQNLNEMEKIHREIYGETVAEVSKAVFQATPLGLVGVVVSPQATKEQKILATLGLVGWVVPLLPTVVGSPIAVGISGYTLLTSDWEKAIEGDMREIMRIGLSATALALASFSTYKEFTRPIDYKVVLGSKKPMSKFFKESQVTFETAEINLKGAVMSKSRWDIMRGNDWKEFMKLSGQGELMAVGRDGSIMAQMGVELRGTDNTLAKVYSEMNAVLSKQQLEAFKSGEMIEFLSQELSESAISIGKKGFYTESQALMKNVAKITGKLELDDLIKTQTMGASQELSRIMKSLDDEFIVQSVQKIPKDLKLAGAGKSVGITDDLISKYYSETILLKEGLDEVGSGGLKLTQLGKTTTDIMKTITETAQKSTMKSLEKALETAIKGETVKGVKVTSIGVVSVKTEPKIKSASVEIKKVFNDLEQEFRQASGESVRVSGVSKGKQKSVFVSQRETVSELLSGPKSELDQMLKNFQEEIQVVSPLNITSSVQEMIREQKKIMKSIQAVTVAQTSITPTDFTNFGIDPRIRIDIPKEILFDSRRELALWVPENIETVLRKERQTFFTPSPLALQFNLTKEVDDLEKELKKMTTGIALRPILVQRKKKKPKRRKKKR